MMFTNERGLWAGATCILLCVLIYTAAVFADDQPQWGQRHSRNMVSSETGLADSFDPASGKNIKWVVSLGTETYSTPVVAGGRVFIGTNNNNPRDPRHQGDRGVLLCLDEKDGSFCWQLVVPKMGTDPYLDWPRAGIVSPATVEGDRVYIVSNRGEVMCLDLNGQNNGNDGPYEDEGKNMTPGGTEPLKTAEKDADIIWRFDIPAQAGVHQHDAAHSSILLDGEFLYVNTSNGLDNRHQSVPEPNAPSLIVLEKKTGRLAARDEEHIGPRIFHCTWSSPASGNVDGRRLVFFGGGDGVCYAFEAMQSAPAAPALASQEAAVVERLRKVWSFDCDPTGPKENIGQYRGNHQEGPSNIKSMPVFHNNRVYVTAGGDIWWGKNQAWLKCIDAGKTGNITNGGEVWSYPLNRHCCSTVSIYEGLVFVADCSGVVHCVDAQTGKAYWTHQTKGEIWASTLVADGKVYIGTRERDFWILGASKDKKVISSIELDSPMAGSPVAANGVLYIATMRKLYAVKKAGE